MPKTKTMTPAEFRELGLVQEVNRRILHPLGLAMSVEVDDDTGEVLRFGDVTDNRDDLEGMIYPNLDTDKAEARARWFDMEEALRHPVRRRALGYVVQPIGGQRADGWRVLDEIPEMGDAVIVAVAVRIHVGPHKGVHSAIELASWNGRAWISAARDEEIPTDRVIGWIPAPVPPPPTL